jgi:AraC family transcriptional regulator
MNTMKSRLPVAEWFQGLPIQVQHSSEPSGWEAATMRLAFIRPHMDQMYLGPQPYDESISMILSGNFCFDAINEGRFMQIKASPGDANVFPANYLFESRWDSAGDVAFIMFNRTCLIELCRDITKGDPTQVQINPVFGLHDAFLIQSVTRLASELRNGTCEPIFADHMSNIMMLCLLKHHSNAYHLPIRTSSRFTLDQRRVLEEFIEANLHTKLSIPQLARLLHISITYFERQFSETYFMAPYQYIQKRRIERAKRLLRDPSYTLFEVATQCGFANQSHFNHRFKEAVGVTPGEYARQVRK